MIIAIMNVIKAIVYRSLKKSGLQRGLNRDLAIPVRRSNQLSYEATDVVSWSFVSSNEPVKNGCEVICVDIFTIGILNSLYKHSNRDFLFSWAGD